MAEATGQLYVVRPAAESADTRQLFHACLQEARAARLGVITVRAETHRLLEGGGARRVDLISPADATGLYRALHRGPVAVLALGTTFVRRDPSRDPPVKRHAIALETFVAHKGRYTLIRPGVDLPHVLADFLRWGSEVHCTGEDDPRVLPLHAFEASGDWSRLGSGPADRRFAQEYGPASARRDERGLSWRKAQDLHGREQLVVAGFRLTTGMHWDVAASGRAARICTGDAVWKLRGRGAYLNVYPDGRTRRPNRPTVKQVWPPR